MLASSVTVPWLSQPVCLPLYRAIGPLIPDGNIDVIQRRFLQVWPTTFLQSLPAVAVFAVPVQLVMGWSWQAFGAFLGLCVLHVAFVQSLIAANVDRRRLRWALAWACYATALIAIPAAWYLPPLVGLISQVVPMRSHLSQLRRTILLDKVDVAADLVRGLLLGAVLWADKLLLFLKSDGVFQVDAIFLALLPAVIAYNYYFIRLAPHIDRAVGDVRTAVEMDAHRSDRETLDRGVKCRRHLDQRERRFSARWQRFSSPLSRAPVTPTCLAWSVSYRSHRSCS